MTGNRLDLGAVAVATAGALVIFVAAAVFVPVLAEGFGPPSTSAAVLVFLVGALLRALVGLLAGLRVTARSERPTAVSTAAPGFLGCLLAFLVTMAFSVTVAVGSGRGVNIVPLDAISGILQWSIEGGLGGLVAYWRAGARARRA